MNINRNNSVDYKITNLLDRYASLEKEIQKLIYQTCGHFCGKCSSRCCKEEICEESIESTFLSMLVERQGVQYDLQNGWMSASGCRLFYGRPLVCYEFFCKDILKSHLFRAINIKKIVNDFVSVGNRARGNTHLICVDNLEIISSLRIDKMIYKIGLATDEKNNIRFHSDGLIVPDFACDWESLW